MPCGVTPTASGEVGRGFGLGPGRTSSAMRLHEGIDWVGARGDKVRCAWGGVVDLVGRDDVPHGPLDGYGNAVVIRTVVPGIGNVWWLYAHLESVAVREGQLVTTGQGIGRVGNTTNGKFPGMGAHLHSVTADRAWPKAYGRGSFDPALAYERMGLRFQPRQSGRRARFVPTGQPCATVGLGRANEGSWAPVRPTDVRYVLGALGVDPAPGDEYEPPPEAFTGEYEVSDLSRVGPWILGFAAIAVGVGVVGSAIAGAIGSEGARR